jgi:hypothetical protein
MKDDIIDIATKISGSYDTIYDYVSEIGAIYIDAQAEDATLE